jgi:hypothetical protein
MKLFSERYEYTKPSDIIIREQITPAIQNAICSCFDRLQRALADDYCGRYNETYNLLNKYVWTHFLNWRESHFPTSYRAQSTITDYIESTEPPWYKKLDIIDFVIRLLTALSSEDQLLGRITKSFIEQLNQEFERLNFAYRIVDSLIVEITSKEEIATIEGAVNNSPNNIRMHLNEALRLYSLRPSPDYRNSIKESISAIEVFCREKTGKSTLGDALKELEACGIIIPNLLNQAFVKLYAYTNQPDTGIRHALMDDKGTYTPTDREAIFMIVTCSAFINYLNQNDNG